MTFRDLSQGTYRMRQIGYGQKIILYIPEEILNLVLTTIPKQRTTSILNKVCEWLIINGMNSEKNQSKQLIFQNLFNIFRKIGFKNSLTNANNKDSWFIKCIDLFKDQVDYDIKKEISDKKTISDSINEIINSKNEFLEKIKLNHKKVFHL
jgi:hypothetical protein